ncbi:MAG: family N-acetyltransferase [Pseudonocardiales bacterium]|nr:family N-acetyltransferase [Pseudonocardiales bacterium]
MSGPVEIRHVIADEIPAFNRSIRTTFLEDATQMERFAPLYARSWDAERAWGAVADGRFVGTLRTLPHQLSVPAPGGHATGSTTDISVDALTAVTVAATHRRQGLLSQMLSDSLRSAHERGDALSILVAAEWAIYGRFGYWPGATWADRIIKPRRPGARLRMPVTGSVRQVELSEVRQLAPAIFAAARRDRAGNIDRDESSWDRRLDLQWRDAEAKNPVAIVHEGDDGIDGLLVWHADHDFGWVDGGKITVEELFASDQAAYSALWGYLLEMDVVEEIKIESRPPDEPLALLMVDGRSVQTTALTDAMWLRLLDVPAALSARGYSMPGRLCFDVVDPDDRGYAAGRYVLDADLDGSSCRPAPELTPQLALSQRALAAIYLGQPSLRAQQAAGLVDELEVGAVARADAMFGTPLQPWVATGF